MRKAILMSSAIIVLATLAFAGTDVWKAKPYQQWDQKDIGKILGDSPWSKVVQVEAPWTIGKSALPDPGQPSTTAAPANGGKTASKSPSGDTPAGNTPGASLPGPGEPQPTTMFAVRWISSRTLQRAAARSAELAGQLKPEDVEKQLANPPDVYEIAVTGPDMRPFQSADDDTLINSATLVEKKTKQKVVPAKVQVARTPDGLKVQSIAFIFDKKSGSGEPTIAEDEKSVDFNCNLNGAKIHASFEIPKMQDNQGRDL